jgi:glycosyltransferase involved in cell wall biosynthesis
MSQERGDYILVVQAPAYSLGSGEFATESAFARHLCELRVALGDRFRDLVLIAPHMTASDYDRTRFQLGIVSFKEHGIRFLPAFPSDSSVGAFWTTYVFSLRKRLSDAIAQADVVHSGMSDDLWRPLMALANWVAWRLRRPVVFVVDIDFRGDSKRYRVLGQWGLRSYLINALLYDPLKWIQIWVAVRVFDLVLLKSQKMVDDFGAGRPNVRNFFDTVHSDDSVLDEQGVEAKIDRLRQSGRPLRLVYFGRLVPYKGLDLSILGVVNAKKRGADIEFTIVGGGECEAKLRQLVIENQAADYIHFAPPVPYGAALFDLLAGFDVMLATPLVEDTPRAAFDSFARGLPIVAFDIGYFRDIAHLSGAVFLSPWPDPSALGKVIADIWSERQELASRVIQSVRFASANTQKQWLIRRTKWLDAVLNDRAP